jgi:hypothetical protein
MRTMLRGKVTLLFLTCAVILLVFPAMASAQGAPTIQSDKADYRPGELVTLTGGNWQPGESVNIKVNDTYGASWSRNVDVTADASGNVTDSFNLPDWFVSDYDVTATGAQSGTATTTFTDGNAAVTGRVTDSVSGQPISGATVTCGTSSGCNNNVSATTNASGNYILPVNFPGNAATLTLTVSKSGYTNNTRTVNVPNNNAIVANQDVALTPSCTAPAITQQPANQSITYGANASFTAAASGTSPSLQWQVKTTAPGAVFTNIPTATSSPLSLTKPPVSDSGNQYRAVFTNACGSATSNAATLTVAQKDLTISGAVANNKPYDGTTNATVNFSGASLVGVESGDSVTINSSGYSANFDNKNVGNDKAVTVTGVTLGGTGAGNYTVSQPSGLTANITPKSLTGSFTAQNKEYDGTRDATVDTRSLPGVISGDTVNLDISNAQFDTKNVGTAKDVTGSLSLSGIDAGNYTVNASHTTKANITAKALTISGLSAQDKFYDGNANATITGTPSLVGVISPDVVTLLGTASGTFNNELVGANKPVTVSVLSLTGGDAGNYSLTLPTLSAAIKAWTLNGFYQPVDMSTGPTTVWNTVKGGSTVPLKFELFTGSNELTATANVKPLQYTKVNCSTTNTTEDAIETLATGGTSLRYDTTGGQFIYNWKTPTGAGSCYKVTMTTQDNSTLSAYFKMK